MQRPGAGVLPQAHQNNYDHASCKFWSRENIWHESWVWGLHGRLLYRQLYQGWRTQTRLAQILDIEMGEKYLYSHQNGGEIFSVKLRRGDLCNPIGVDLFEIRDTIYGTRVCGIGKKSTGKLFASSSLGKSKTLPPIVGILSTLPVKKYGLSLQNLVTSSAEKYTSYLHAS